MTKNVLSSIFAAARSLFGNLRALLLLLALYLALIAACFFFITTREANTWQLLVTFAAALFAPLLFFVLQAAGASYAVGERGPGALLRRTARNFLKVFAISIPLVLLTVLSVYLLNKLENRVQLTPEERASAQYSAPSESEDETEASSTETATRKPPPVRWKYLFVSALRLVVLAPFLPLAAMHLWLAAARDGLWPAIKRSPRLIARAFSARSVLTYGVGMIFFALIPYFLITKRMQVSSNTLELVIFGGRILLAFALSLFGWVMTMTALANLDSPAPAIATPLAAPPPPPPQFDEAPAGATTS